MNREMLKEAIAEAKTIKETAIANAKAALEEAFTPQLTAMFAERLNEEDEEEELKENTTDESLNELEETFNLDEILAELEMTDKADDMVSEEDMDKMDEDLMLEEMSDEEIEELVMKVIDDMIETGKLMPGEGEEEEDMEDMDDMDGEEVEVKDEEEVELDELLNELLGEEKEEVSETMFTDPQTLQLVAQAADFLNISKDAVMAMIAGLPATIAAAGFLRGVLKGKKEATKEEVEETADTSEMEETIAELRNELNEVNLLNAKLLYTNKIFKAKNLTESEKIKVLNTFDKAETVKEVKLVFETLTESFKATAKKAPIKESLGSASRSIAPAQAKQPIIEVNDAFARMQRLAGLRK
jgi:hypothetical protein